MKVRSDDNGDESERKEKNSKIVFIIYKFQDIVIFLFILVFSVD